jgi:outer membrane protein
VSYNTKSLECYMKRLTGLALAAVLAVPAAQAANLSEVLELALQSDPQLREADANRLAAQEAKPLARSVLLPQINLGYSRDYNKDDGTTRQFDAAQNKFVDVPAKQTADTDQLNLQLQQSVFRWDQWVSLRQADSTIAQAEADYQAAEQNLFQRVAQRYFDVLSARDSLDATVASKEAVARQLEQAETRFEVGLIAITDVREAQAAYDTAVADEIAAKRTLGTSKELLREVTGEYFDELLAPSEELPLVPPEPQDVEQWVGSSLQQNSTVVSSRIAVDIAGDTIDIRRAGHYPTVDLVAGHVERGGSIDTTVNDPILGPQTSNIPNDGSTDTISLRFNIPIYSGGGTSARVRQAVLQQRAAKDRLDRALRETERLTRDSYAGVISEISRVAALKKALESSQTALEATEAGFEVGTRTTVDVLIARQNLTTARTAYLKSRYDYLLNVVALKLAAGSLSDADLVEINQWLK